MERERSQSYPDVQTQPLIETSSSLEFFTVLPTTLFPSTNLPFIPQPGLFSGHHQCAHQEFLLVFYTVLISFWVNHLYSTIFFLISVLYVKLHILVYMYLSTLYYLI